MSDIHIFNIPLHTLLHREDDIWVAHALDVDVMSQGDTREEALEMVMDAIICKASFSIQRGHENYFNRAPKKYFEQWEKAQASQLHRAVSGQEGARLKFEAVFIEMEPAAIREPRKFAPVEQCA